MRKSYVGSLEIRATLRSLENSSKKGGGGGRRQKKSMLASCRMKEGRRRENLAKKGESERKRVDDLIFRVEFAVSQSDMFTPPSPFYPQACCTVYCTVLDTTTVLLFFCPPLFSPTQTPKKR